MPIHGSAALLLFARRGSDQTVLQGHYRATALEGSLSGTWLGTLISGCYPSLGPSAQYPAAGAGLSSVLHVVLGELGLEQPALC